MGANVAVGTSVMLLGDAGAQLIEHRASLKRTTTAAAAAMVNPPSFCFDSTRLGVVVLWTALVDMPINVVNFAIWGRVFAEWGVAANANLRFSALKALCFFASGTVIRNPLYIGFVTTFEHAGENWREGRALTSDAASCAATVRRKLWDTLPRICADSAVVWLPITTMTFYALQPEYRVVATGIATVFWYAHLSIIQHEDGGAEETALDPAAAAAAAAAAAPEQ